MSYVRCHKEWTENRYSLNIYCLLLTTESLGVPGTLLIDLTMKPPSGFESVNPGLVIGKPLINSLFFHYKKVMYKIFKIQAEYDR